MSKTKTKYVCNECGYTSVKWLGKCPSCDSWGTIEEEVEVKYQKISSKENSKSLNINEIEIEDNFRLKSSFLEFDNVLGGGLILGEVLLITGNPGIGKSTFLLQLMQDYSKTKKVLYVSGEESEKQIKERANRLKIKSKNLYIINENELEYILQTIENENYDIVVIDSIQTLYSNENTSLAGSVSQIRDCALKIINLAKSKDISFYIVGHVTKDGKLAGPKILEHMVDAVFSFDGEENTHYRVIRSLKNRYGSTNEIAIFSMKEDGVSEISNPSEFFISQRDEKNIGSIITTSIEGSRVILFEIQTLTIPLKFGIPKRIIKGYDKNRVEILSAVISKNLEFDLSNTDIYLNIPGNLDLKDQSADLAIVLSLISTIKDIKISQKIAAIGEIGLRGELRKVSFIKKRILELEKLGFSGIYLPKAHEGELYKFKTNIKLNYINNIKELLERL